jgi:large subunit ribosomal protein L35
MAKQKQKTHKGIKKRFRLTGTGKVKHRKCGTSHLAAHKTHKNKRQLRGTRVLGKEMTQKIVTVLAGYSS